MNLWLTLGLFAVGFGKLLPLEVVFDSQDRPNSRFYKCKRCEALFERHLGRGPFGREG